MTWRPAKYLSFSFDWTSTLSQREIQFTGRSLYTKLHMGRGWINFEITNRSGFTPSLGLGGGFVIAQMKGVDGVGEIEVPNGDTSKVAFGGLQALFRIRLTSLLFLKSGFRAGMLKPRLRARFPDGTASSLHPLLLGGFIELEVLLFGAKKYSRR